MKEETSNFITKDDVTEEMNRQHAAVTLGGKFAVLCEENVPGEGHEIHFMSLPDMRFAYANKCVDVKNGDSVKNVNPVNIWLKHPDRREFKGVCFEPGIETQGYYNLYKGFGVEPKKGDTRLYHEHGRNIICAGDDALFEWKMDWKADLIQNPGGDRPGTAIVYKGKQGVGKGADIHPFKKILGQHFKHVTGQEQFTGRFNSHLKDGLLCFVDEGYWAGSKQSEGRLKGLITESSTLLELKFKDAVFIKNHIRLVIASNSEWVVPAGMEERRMCVLDVSEDRRGDRSYFKRLFKWIEGPGPAALLYELLNREIKSDLRTIPRTEALLDQILQSLDSVGKFWVSRLYEGIIGNDNTWPRNIRTATAYTLYQSYCTDIRERHPAPDNQFTKRLKKLAPGIKATRPYYDDGQHRALALPYLDNCRTAFENMVDMEIDWNDEDVTPF